MNDLHYFVKGKTAFEFNFKGVETGHRYYRYNTKGGTLEYTDENVRLIKKANKIKWNISDTDLINFLDVMRTKGTWTLVDLK